MRESVHDPEGIESLGREKADPSPLALCPMPKSKDRVELEYGKTD